ncbi:MAG: hypothetical protein ACFFAJ_17440 [Candidatus Hodarchaeota archaeon]
MSTDHNEEINSSTDLFEKAYPNIIKDKIFHTTYSYVETFDNTDYLDTISTNASGWGDGIIKVDIESLFTIILDGGLATTGVEWLSPAIVQSISCYSSKGFVHNVTIFANQTVFPNTSIHYQISTDNNVWIPITLNETYSFTMNPYHGLYWRAVLEANDPLGSSPYIDSIKIDFDVFYDTEPPTIALINGRNNTAISPGTVIECSLNDYLLDQCWFNWDNGINLRLISPWAIVGPTSEGYHWLTVHANDSVGHLTTVRYQFYVNYSPLVELQSSLNNSIIIPLTEIKFLIMDPTLTSVWYQWDSLGNSSLLSPFIVKAINSSGFHMLTVGARDSWNNITIKTYCFYILGSISVEITRNPPSIVYSGENFIYSFTIINTQPISLNLLLIVIGLEDDVLTGNGSQIVLNPGENTTIELEIRPKHASIHQLEIYLLYEGLVYYSEILQFNVAPQWMSPTFLFQVLIFVFFIVIVSSISIYYFRKQFESRRLLWEQHDQLTRLIDKLTIANLEANITREAEATGSDESSIRPLGFPQYLHLSEPLDQEALQQQFYSLRNQIENGDPNNLQELSELLAQAEELLEELQEEAR